jgi:hypothetical protein
MIGTVLAASNTGLFSNENYDTLATKLTLYSSKLLKKPDQCRMVYRCAHLFWGQPMTEMNRKQIQRMLAADTTGAAPEPEERWFYRDGKRVLECLQKALKIADACMDSLVNVELFIEILRQYAHFYQLGNPAVTLKYVNGLVDLIYSNMLALHSDPTLKAASAKPAKVDENNPDSPMAPRIQSGMIFIKSLLTTTTNNNNNNYYYYCFYSRRKSQRFNKRFGTEGVDRERGFGKCGKVVCRRAAAYNFSA